MSSAPLTGDALVADNQARAAALGVQISGVGGKMPTISVNGLNSGGVPSPYQVTPPAPSSAGAGLAGAIDSNTSTYAANLAAARDAAKSSKNDSLDALTAEMEKAGGVAEDTNNAYKTYGVDAAQGELTSINNEITSEKNALNHSVLAIQKNPNGMSASALAGEVDRVTNISLAKQADLSVIQMAKQGQYDSAKAIADRSVAAQTEAEQNKINALQATYDANKDEFSTAEQEAFSAAQADRQAQLDEQKTTLSGISNLAIEALKNGAPTSVARAIQSSKTLADATLAAGSYLKAPTAGDLSTATAQALGSRLEAAKGPDGFTDPNLYASLRASSSLSASEFDNRFGYLVNPASTARLGISNTSANAASFGAPTSADKSAVFTAIGDNPSAAASIDMEKLSTDPTYFYWVKSQLGV